MKYLVNLDLSQNQLLNLGLQQLATPPDNPVVGQMYFNTTVNRAFICYQIDPEVKWRGSDAVDSEQDIVDIVNAINTSTDPVLTIQNAHLQLMNTNQDANKVLASPDGTSGLAAYRYLVVPDLPHISSDELREKITDETGTGVAVFNNAPTIIDPKIEKIRDINGNEIIILRQNANAINEVTISNGPSGVAPRIEASGDETNVSLVLAPKGTGSVQAPTRENGDSTTAIATTAFVNAEIASDATPITHIGTRGDQHDVVTQEINGFMIAADKLKLDQLKLGAAGTTSTTFTLDYDNSGAGADKLSYEFNRGTDAAGPASLTWVEADKEFQLTSDSSHLGDLRVYNLYVDGTMTHINSEEVDIGDSKILLNADITSSAFNSDGGVGVKRLDDGGLRKDAELIYNNTSNRWETVFGSVSTVQVTAAIANKVTATVGDTIHSSFTITHNLNTRDLVVSVREAEGTPPYSSYAQVYTDIEMDTLNTIKVKFAEIPTLGQYVVTIIG